MVAPLRSVLLENFRGFKRHTVSLTPTTILVGQNNAGKSTFIDALRILAVAVRRAGQARYEAPPLWLASADVGFGYRLSFETIDFDFSNVQYNHNTDEPTLLQLLYHDKTRVRVWLGRSANESFAQVTLPDGAIASSPSDKAKLEIPSIYVMPPLQNLISHEKRISKSRINEFLFGRLASRHFRNQLYEKTAEYNAWTRLLQETWPSIAVNAFDSGVGEGEDEFSLILREGPFASEAAWVGGGLQAWMQILWFLCRTPLNGVAVLDEPDVYLHADMQRKLIKLLGSRGHQQIIVATHSSEIISDTPAETITVVRKRAASSWRPLTKTKLQGVIDNLGSKHNIQLSKIAAARKMVVFEGEDQKFLSEVAFRISVDCYDHFIKTPAFELNGVTNWHQAIGAAKALAVASDGSIPVHLVIDRDFRDAGEIESIKSQSGAVGLVFHLWRQKEIENYFVSAAAISRVIEKQSKNTPPISEIELLISDACAELKGDVIAAIADKWQQANRNKAASTAFSEAQKIFSDMSATRPIEEIVSGKKLISLISEKCQDLYGVSFGAMTLCKAMHKSEYDPQLIEVIESVS